jgi:hypothetical protein
MGELFSFTAAHKARELTELVHVLRGGTTLLLGKH